MLWHFFLDILCINNKISFPLFCCQFLGCITSNSSLQMYFSLQLQIQKSIVSRYIVHYRPNVQWSRACCHSNSRLVGCWMPTPRKCTFQISNKIVKAADGDPRVNTIKSPQSNPDISNGQIHHFWGDDFEANIFGELLQHLNLTRSSTLSNWASQSFRHARISSIWVIFFIFSSWDNCKYYSSLLEHFFEINEKSTKRIHPSWTNF